MLSNYQAGIHFVIDIETLGTEPGCPILSIAAVKVYDGAIQDSLILPIQIQDNFGRGLYKIDLETILWWLSKHSEQFVETITISNRIGVSISDALSALYDFINEERREKRKLFFWCKHPQFDFSILEHCYKSIFSPVPWKFYEIRDISTLEDKKFIDEMPEAAQHDALADAQIEARTLISAVWGGKNG